MLITIFEMITWKTTYGEIQARTSSGKAGELSNDMETSPSPDICDTIKNDSLSLFPMNFHFVTHKSSVPLKKKTEITDKAQGRTILPAIERNASKNAQEELDWMK